MDMTDAYIDHMENYRHIHQDHLVNRCLSVFPHSPGCAHKMLAEQNVDFILFLFSF